MTPTIVTFYVQNSNCPTLCRVAPLLCIGNTSFVAISTLTSDMNFYTKLISKLDPQTQLPVFKSIQIQLACQACIDAEKAHECVHLQHLIPRWQVGTFVSCALWGQTVLIMFCNPGRTRRSTAV